MKNIRWIYSLTLLLILAILAVLSPRPKAESSVYRLLDEPLRSTQLFKNYLQEFPSDSNKLSTIIVLNQHQSLVDLKKALDLTIRENTNIWEQYSIFDLRSIESDPQEKIIFYPKLGANLEKLESNSKDQPLAAFFYNAEKRAAYIEWKINPDLNAQDTKVSESVVSGIRQTLEQSLGNSSDILFGGPFFLEYHFQRGLKQNLILGIGSALVLAVVIYFLFPQILWVLLVLFVTILVQQLLAAGMYWANYKLSPLSSCLFLMMTVAIVQDFIFLFYVKVKRQVSFRESAGQIKLASFLTSFTTALGFGSLIFTDSPKVQQFAVWAFWGTLLEWFLVIFVCPALLDKIDRKKFSKVSPTLRVTVDLINKFSSLFDYWVKHRRKTLIRLVILSLLLALFAITKAQVGYNLFETFSRRHPVGQFIKKLQETKGVSGEISVFIPNKVTPDEKKRIREQISAHRDWGILSPEDFIQMNTKDFPVEIQDLTQRTFFQADELKAYDNGKAERIRVFLPDLDSKALANVESKLQEICRENCYPVGEVLVLNEISLSFLNQLYKSLGSSFLLVGLILLATVFLRDRRQSFPVLISSFWGPTVFLGIVSALGITINVTICLCITVFAGLAGDSSIQFLISKQEKESFDQSIDFLAPASAITFGLMTINSLLFVFSSFAVTQQLAWLFPMGFFLLYVGDILILKLLAAK